MIMSYNILSPESTAKAAVDGLRKNQKKRTWSVDSKVFECKRSSISNIAIFHSELDTRSDHGWEDEANMFILKDFDVVL